MRPCLAARAVLTLAIALVMSTAVSGTSSAIVGGVRDCSVNALHQAGKGCTFPTVGALLIQRSAGGPLRSICTQRLLSNELDRAVILTAAHCVHPIERAKAVTFDSQVVDDSVTPYRRDVVLPERAIFADQVILHPHQRSEFTPGTGPLGNSQPYTANDLALLVIDEPSKLERLDALWTLLDGPLAKLPPVGFLDSLSPAQFRELPLMDVGYGTDWIDETGPSGRVNRGNVGNAGFRTTANLTPIGRSEERLLTAQNQQKDLEGICYGDSGSSAFTRNDGTGEVTILALPTWVNDGGTKCHSTVQWLRLDRPDALRFVRCAFTSGGGAAVRNCVDAAFAP